MATTVSAFVSGSVSTIDQSGSANWTNATVAQLSSDNAAYATCSLTAGAPTDLSDKLRAIGFNCGVPSGAVLIALWGVVDRKANGTGVRALSGYDVQAASGASAHASDLADIGTSDSAKTVGNTNTFAGWSANPTVADANSASTYIECDFVESVAAARTVSVDYFQLNATYDIVSKTVGSRQRGNRRDKGYDVLMRCVASSMLGGIVASSRRLVAVTPLDPERPPLSRIEVARCLPYALVLG